MESKNKLSNIKCRSIQIFNHQIKDKKVIYTMEIKLNNKQSIIITERYSELLNLHNAMSKEAKLPDFPPKKYFGNTEENFLNLRQLNLNRYYQIITSSHIYSNLSSFKSWIFNKLGNIHIEEKDELKYDDKIEDLSVEKQKQEHITKYINSDIIPLFLEYNNNAPNDDLDQDNNFQNKESKENIDKKEIKENAYLDLINKELFLFVENNYIDISLTGNNNNFNFIGNRKNNILKMEKIFNNKLNELNENINIKCLEKFQTPDVLMIFDL